MDALFGKSKQAILGLFFGNPETEYHLREVARRAGMSIGAVNRDLTSLVEAGILSSEKRGNQLFFRADKGCTIFDELHGIAIKTIGLADRFREALAPLSSKVKIAYIYGSIARGEERAESDIDVMVIGEVKAFEIAKALASVHELFKREINPTVFSVAEYQQKLADQNHFLQAQFPEQKIFLIGDEDTFRRLG